MNSEGFIDAMGLVSDAHKQEALDTVKIENKVHFDLGRTIRTALIAAAVVCLLIGGAYAADYLVNSPEQAKGVFQRELKEMQELGLLSEDVGALQYSRCTEEKTRTDSFFPGRIFHKHYFISAQSEGGQRSGYWIYAYVDMASGKITQLDVQAFADENDEVVRESGEYKFYENFDDIFDPSLTVGEYCDMLAAYWGFSGWTLGAYDGRVPEDGYIEPTADTLLKDIPILNGSYYLPVYFDGDEGDAPRYIELIQFPDAVMLMFGVAHALG